MERSGKSKEDWEGWRNDTEEDREKRYIKINKRLGCHTYPLPYRYKYDPEREAIFDLTMDDIEKRAEENLLYRAERRERNKTIWTKNIRKAHLANKERKLAALLAEQQREQESHERNKEFLNQIRSKVKYGFQFTKEYIKSVLTHPSPISTNPNQGEFLICGTSNYAAVKQVYRFDGSIDLYGGGIEAEERRYDNPFPEMWDKPYYERLW